MVKPCEYMSRYNHCMINDNHRNKCKILILGFGLPKSITNQHCIALGLSLLVLLRLNSTDDPEITHS